MLQKDGVVVYEAGARRAGFDLFRDSPQRDYPGLASPGKLMVSEKKGSGGAEERGCLEDTPFL